MRRIAVVSVDRSDRGHLAPLVKELADEAILMKFDMPIAERLPMRSFTDTPLGISRTSASAVSWFAHEYERLKPDLVVLLGDRYEMLAAALASLPFVLPLAHIHGGETTRGAYDNQIRHALTKMSHLHFVSHRRHASRVYRMGEERWRIHVTGAPGLDRIPAEPAHTREQLAALWSLDLSLPWIIVTLHPETLDPAGTWALADAMCAALAEFPEAEYVITKPGPDTAHIAITNRLLEFCREHKRARIVTPDDAEYLSLMAHAACMVGNSSSGIIEAPTLRLPVVNIGRRQKGRTRGDNVVDVDASAHQITLAVGWPLTCGPLAMSGINPYGDGHAAPRIAKVLREIPIDRKLVEKR